MARMSATIAATLAKSIPLEPAVARGTVTGGAFSSSSGWCSSGPSLGGESAPAAVKHSAVARSRSAVARSRGMARRLATSGIRTGSPRSTCP